MGASTTYAPWKAQWNALIAAIEAAMTAGTIPTVQSITRSLYPAQEILPAIGVQFKTAAWSDYSQNQRFVKTKFGIVLAIVQSFSTQSSDTPGAALTAIEPLVNNGSGGGLEPLLNTLGQLGGTALRTYITSLELDVIPGEDAAAQSIAFAEFEFVCENIVRIH